MKNLTLLLSLLLLITLAALSQSYGGLGIGPIAPTSASCPSPTSGQAILCPVGSGTSYQVYVSYSGGIYAPLTGAVTIPVTSVFGRTGAIVSVSGDYSYSQLASPPTTISCTTASLSTGSSGTLTASGCTI